MSETKTAKAPPKPMTIGPIETEVPSPIVAGIDDIKALIEKMKPGESVFVENCNNSMRSVFYRAAKEIPAFMVSVAEKTEKREGVRFWRVATKPSRKYAATAKPVAK